LRADRRGAGAGLGADDPPLAETDGVTLAPSTREDATTEETAVARE
jgi:hypothetical protein